MSTEEDKKPVFRIVIEKAMNQQLEQMKAETGVTIAEHFRRAMKVYLLFCAEGKNEVDEVALMRFLIDWQAKHRKKGKFVK